MELECLSVEEKRAGSRDSRQQKTAMATHIQSQRQPRADQLPAREAPLQSRSDWTQMSSDWTEVADAGAGPSSPRGQFSKQSAQPPTQPGSANAWAFAKSPLDDLPDSMAQPTPPRRRPSLEA